MFAYVINKFGVGNVVARACVTQNMSMNGIPLGPHATHTSRLARVLIAGDMCVWVRVVCMHMHQDARIDANGRGAARHPHLPCAYCWRYVRMGACGVCMHVCDEYIITIWNVRDFLSRGGIIDANGRGAATHPHLWLARMRALKTPHALHAYTNNTRNASKCKR